MMVSMKKYMLLLIFLFTACSTANDRVQKKRMKNNISTEKIYRLSHEKAYEVEKPKLVRKMSYPWESETAYPKITMDTLRCRGDISHEKKERGGKVYEDCKGLYEHGLPYVDGEEFVYPVLVHLLNKVQGAFDKKVVVTSGHRCPKHNTYLSLGKSKISRYMIGAKVDFYVEGMENNTEEIIERIMHFYSDEEDRYSRFQRVSHDNGSYSWKNKEISISISREGEHSIIEGKKNSVISIEVRYDRDREELVRVEWDKAYQGFIRH